MQQQKTTQKQPRILIATAPVADPDLFNAAERIRRSNALRAAAAPVAPELLEGRSMMSATSHDAFNADAAVVDHGSVDMNLKHAPHGILAASSDGSSDTKQSKAERRPGRQPAREQRKADKQAAKDAKAATRAARKAARAARHAPQSGQAA